MFKLSLIVLIAALSSTAYGATLVTLSSTCLSDFTNAVLLAHNNYRTLHATPSLVYNNTIAAIALKFGNYLGQNDLFQHSNVKGLGENLAYSWSSSAPNLNSCGTFGTSFAKMWYDEIKLYNYNAPGFSSGTGHFTQLVWKSTKQLGCGLTVTSANKVFGVCNYSPQGNIVNAGYFAANVLPLA